MTEIICKYDFFEQAPDDQHQRIARFVGGNHRANELKLTQQIMRPHNRTGDQMRPKRNKSHVVDEMPRRFHLTPINLDRVAHRLKGIERDSGRQSNRQSGDANVAPAAASPRFALLMSQGVYLKKARRPRFAERLKTSKPLRYPASSVRDNKMPTAKSSNDVMTSGIRYH